MRLPNPRVNIDTVNFYGGLDLETPALNKKPGAIDVSKNYVADTNGGYSRIDAYERFSGQPLPSDAVYYQMPVTYVAAIIVGDTVTGAVTGETAVVITVGSNYLNVTKYSGDFNEDENLTVGAVHKATVNGVIVQSGESTMFLHSTALNLAADVYRADIVHPVGSGKMRGLSLLRGVLYAFRNNAGDTAGTIYKQSTSGWVEITLHHEISFDTGVALISDGDAITQLVSGATATVQRVVLESGAWGTTAAGRLILSAITGTFDATNDIQVAAATKATSTSLATAITIAKDGEYRFKVTNFSGATDNRRIYGCDGVNKGFEFDGTTYVPINSGFDTDTPEEIIEHKRYLIFSYKSSHVYSDAGDPYQFSTEIAEGDNITGFAKLPGEALAVTSRNSMAQIEGTGVSNFVNNNLSADVGAISNTIQQLGPAYCLDDRGIITVNQSDKFGNFELNTLSRKVQASIDAIRPLVTCSTIYKRKNQYRLYGSTGTGICMTILDKGVAFATFEYPDYITCAVSGEDSNGNEIIFLGSDDGCVFQAEKGSSFDGEDIEAYLGFPFNHSGSPQYIKSYLTATVEMVAQGYSDISYYPVFSYGDTEIPEHSSINVLTEGGGGFWDTSFWGSFFYDGEAAAKPVIPITGDGTNMSLTIYNNNQIDIGHKIDGLSFQYILRRRVR